MACVIWEWPTLTLTACVIWEWPVRSASGLCDLGVACVICEWPTLTLTACVIWEWPVRSASGLCDLRVAHTHPDGLLDLRVAEAEGGGGEDVGDGGVEVGVVLEDALAQPELAHGGPVQHQGEPLSVRHALELR